MLSFAKVIRVNSCITRLRREAGNGDEYRVKWYLFRDALLENRTDGALVRIITPIIEGEPEEKGRSTHNRLPGGSLALTARLCAEIRRDAGD